MFCLRRSVYPSRRPRNSAATFQKKDDVTRNLTKPRKKLKENKSQSSNDEVWALAALSTSAWFEIMKSETLMVVQMVTLTMRVHFEALARVQFEALARAQSATLTTGVHFAILRRAEQLSVPVQQAGCGQPVAEHEQCFQRT